jgi:hypothetical protein
VKVDFNNFLLSLASALAEACAPSLELRKDLFIGQANESDAQAAGKASWAVLRIYGGDAPASYPGGYQVARAHKPAVQCEAVSKDPMAAMDLCQKIYLACFDEDQFPRNHWSIAGKRMTTEGAVETDPEGDWEVRLVTLRQGPGQIGIDEAGRLTVVFNFDVEFERKG